MSVALSVPILSDPSFCHLIFETYPLDQVAAAHKAVESRCLSGNAALLIE